MADEIKTSENGNGDEEQIIPVKDMHTWIDEITNNVAKILFILFAFAGTGYCIVMFVGKDKGVDPNLVYGFFTGMITTIMPAYFIMRSKKDRGQIGQ